MHAHADVVCAAPYKTQTKPVITENAPSTTDELCPDPEEALIARCMLGERAAFSALFALHQDRVFGMALRLAGDPADAADILQDVFLRVYRGLKTFRQDAAFSTWLYRLTVNAARTYLAKRSKQRAQETPLIEVEALPHAQTRASDPISRKHLLQALEQLPPRYREVLVLHDVEGLQHKEIAAILGVEVGTSKSQLHKARKTMRASLQEISP